MATYTCVIIPSLYYIFLIPILANPISFELSHFEADSSIVYQGDAVTSSGGDAIELNKVNYSNRVGMVTYVDKVRLWDQTSGKVSDFSTHFTFMVDTLNQSSGQYGHGLTFFISPIDFRIPPNSNGGFLGLLNTSTAFSSNNQMIVVEFDSFPDQDWDPPYEHVGINLGTINSTKHAPWNASQRSGDIAHVWVTYDAATKNFNVVWSYQSDNSLNNKSISLQIDLKEAIPEFVSIGFSAATDQLVERNSLQSWKFTSNLKVKVESIIFQLLVGLMSPFVFLVLGSMTVSFIMK